MKRLIPRVLLGLALATVVLPGMGCDDDDYGSYRDWGFGFDYLPSFGGIGDYFESSYESFGGGYIEDDGYFGGGYEEGFYEEGGGWWEDDWKKKNAGKRK